MRYYVIADLHGRLDLLEEAFTIITADAKDAEYKIVTLGDYIDRGPMSKQVIATLMNCQNGSQMGNQLVCLKGNHEAMAVESISSLPNINWWISNGGRETIKSYGFDVVNGFSFDQHYGVLMPQGVIPDEHVKWMASLPLYLETEKQVFVHAGIPQSQMALPPKNPQRAEEMMWMIYDRNDGRGWKDKHVVHGHHQFADGPHVWQGRTDLDTFAWKTGRLVIGVFDDTQGPATRFLEVLGDDYKRD